jgi:hypothetical protein
MPSALSRSRGMGSTTSLACGTGKPAGLLTRWMDSSTSIFGGGEESADTVVLKKHGRIAFPASCNALARAASPSSRLLAVSSAAINSVAGDSVSADASANDRSNSAFSSVNACSPDVSSGSLKMKLSPMVFGFPASILVMPSAITVRDHGHRPSFSMDSSSMSTMTMGLSRSGSPRMDMRMS